MPQVTFRDHPQLREQWPPAFYPRPREIGPPFLLMGVKGVILGAKLVDQAAADVPTLILKVRYQELEYEAPFQVKDIELAMLLESAINDMVGRAIRDLGALLVPTG